MGMSDKSSLSVPDPEGETRALPLQSGMVLMGSGKRKKYPVDQVV